MKKLFISLGILSAVILGAAGTLAIATPSAQALSVYKACGSDVDANSSVCKAANKDELIGGVLKNVINTLIFIIAIISVIVIIIGGIRFTTSGGDPGQAASARNTIIYAVVGLVVAIMSYAIVNFVLNHVGAV